MSTMRAVVYDRPEQFEVREVAVPAPGAGRGAAQGGGGRGLRHRSAPASRRVRPDLPADPGPRVRRRGRRGRRRQRPPTWSGTGSWWTTPPPADAASSAAGPVPPTAERLVAQGVNAPGGFAEYVVTDADRCFTVDDLDPEVAVLAEPVACVVHGLDILDLRAGVRRAAVRRRTDRADPDLAAGALGRRPAHRGRPDRGQARAVPGSGSGRDRPGGPRRPRGRRGPAARAGPGRVRRGHRRHRAPCRCWSRRSG